MHAHQKGEAVWGVAFGILGFILVEVQWCNEIPSLHL